MKKYFFIIVSFFIFVVYCNSQSGEQHTKINDNVVNSESEVILKEVWKRNGGKDELLLQPVEVKRTNLETAANKEQEETQVILNKTVEAKKQPKKPFFGRGRTAFATGINLTVGAANPYFKIQDFFKPVLEVDAYKIDKALPKSGFSIAALFKLNMFLNIYLKDKYEFGSNTGTNVYTFSNIPKNVVSLVAKGNKTGEILKGKFTSDSYSFADTSIFFGMKVGKLKFKFDASYFVPLAYVQYDVGDYIYENDPITGKVHAKGKATVRVYSDLPVFGGTSVPISKIFEDGGFDLGFSGSYEFSKLANLNFGLKSIPILPARVNNGFETSIDGNFDIDSIISYLHNMILPGNSKSNVAGPTSNFTSSEVKYNLPPKKILRPIKLSFSSDIRPFLNNYLIITPNLGCNCLRPFYIDFGCRIESQFLKVLGAYYSFTREDRIWKNRLGFFMDARILRFDFAVATAATSFVGSFKGTGAEASFGIVFGY